MVNERKSLRTAYGETLVSLGGVNPDIVVLEADLSKSTMGTLFEKAFPSRFFEMGIAEANMASAAAGLALSGKTPFMASFAVFATGRCYDQIRTSVCIPSLNVKICGSSAGLSDFGDGSTHQSIDDIALMRVLPNMQVFVPADAKQTAAIVSYMAAHPGPMYIRICRNDLPLVTPDEDFVPGQIQVLRDGKGGVVIACGAMVEQALLAAEMLEKENFSLKVINLPSIKPLDMDALASACEPFSCVFTMEEHSIYAGMGSAVAEALSQTCPKKIIRIGVPDIFGTSAEDYKTVLSHYHLTASDLVERMKQQS